jgi:hypothetical protein
MAGLKKASVCVCGEDQWEIVLKKLRPINLGTPRMLCLQISEGKNIVNFACMKTLVSFLSIACENLWGDLVGVFGS